MRLPFICLVASAGLIATNATAQEVLAESFSAQDTNGRYYWTLSGPTTGNFTRGKADTRSIHKKVDEVSTATSIQYIRQALSLDAGTYVATVRMEKFKSVTTGIDDFELKALLTGSPSVTITKAEQKLDKLVYTKTMLFTLTTKTGVLFSFSSKTSSGAKTDYRFDSFHVGRVERGRAALVESIDRRWSFSHGCPHKEPNVRDTNSTIGFVAKISQNGSSPCGTGVANWWWVRMWSKPKSFLPGVHTANVKFKKIVSTRGAHNFVWWYQVSTNNGTNWSPGTKMTWFRSRHTVGKWVYSPNLSFTVTNPNHLYRFRIDAYTSNDPFLKQTNSFKSNYHMDTLEVRRGEFMAVGDSCMNSGNALMEGFVPQLREKFEISVGPLGSVSGPVTMVLGLNNPNVDLSAVGWQGCFQYARLDILVGMTVASGEAKLSLTVPNDPNLINVKFWTQAYAPGGAGIVTSNGVRGMVGN